MDIYTYLKKDHRHVSALMEQILASRSAQKREALLEEVTKELLLHAETEQKTFYAALDEYAKTRENIEEAEEEHKEIKSYLAKLNRLNIDSEQWIEQFGEFKHAVEHHVKEEEGRIFEKAKQILDHEDAVELAEEMDALKAKKMLRRAA